jgi:hypothetical protein
MTTVWTPQPQECEGNYHFSGQFLVTHRVKEKLSDTEIVEIYRTTQKLVETSNGIDYLLVFNDDQGRKLFFVDQLNEEMIASGDHPEEHNHCTLLFADEY